MGKSKSKLTAADLPYRPCVGLMVLNAQGQVWIGRRSGQEKLRDKSGDQSEVPPKWWQMPQGGIDRGETPVEAAYRELFEETGIAADQVEIVAESANWVKYDLPKELLGRIWKGRFRGQTQRWFVMRYKGSDGDINITPDDPEMIEFDQWRWADVDELMGLVIPFKREVYEAVLAEFGELAKPKV
ncbi:MAG: RNA pyrophosphohydrolase [Pseudomonadota bacterium]